MQYQLVYSDIDEKRDAIQGYERNKLDKRATFCLKRQKFVEVIRKNSPTEKRRSLGYRGCYYLSKQHIDGKVNKNGEDSGESKENNLFLEFTHTLA